MLHKSQQWGYYKTFSKQLRTANLQSNAVKTKPASMILNKHNIMFSQYVFIKHYVFIMSIHGYVYCINIFTKIFQDLPYFILFYFFPFHSISFHLIFSLSQTQIFKLKIRKSIKKIIIIFTRIIYRKSKIKQNLSIFTMQNYCFC